MENTGFKFESRIFYFIDLQNEEDYAKIKHEVLQVSWPVCTVGIEASFGNSGIL